MTIECTACAFRLCDVTPLAKLVAICVSDRCGPPGLANKHVDLKDIVKWTGAGPDYVLQTFDELEMKGVECVDLGNDRFEFIFQIPPEPPQLPSPEEMLSIYVASADGATKIGIARDAKIRFKALQSTIPNGTLVSHFVARARASIARKVERLAHAHLSYCRTNGEWFRTSPRAAVDVVKNLLAELQTTA
jgi:hypothetical protein